MEKLINRQMLPNVPPVTWEQLVKDYPPFTIALDGFCSAGPRFQSKFEGGPRANFNHHEEVDRDSTTATCMQVLDAIRMGLLKEFSSQGNPHMLLPINDCDEDVALSTFILENPDRCISTSNPMLNKLVDITNKQDMYAGMYPFPIEGSILRRMAWIYQPYRKARLNGTVDRRNAEEFNEVIDDVHSRINKFLIGEGKEIPLNMDYNVISGGNGWSMIEEIGEQARYALYHDKIEAFISVRNRVDGKYTYSFGRVSKYIPFPVLHILNQLNEMEGLTNSPNQYGGGTNIGGSPRATGTTTPPEEMIRKVNHIVSEWRSQIVSAATA